MAEFDLRNLKMNFTHIENSEDAWHPNGISGINKSEFLKLNSGINESIFKEIDFNSDGYISEDEYNMAVWISGEDGILTNQEKNDACMEEMLFFARREIDKWFKIDKNRDAQGSNVEWLGWYEYNDSGKTLVGQMSNEELEKYFNEKEVIEPNEFQLEDWLKDNIDKLKNDAKRMYGVELSEKQIIELKKEQIKQLNTWLLKTGDGKDAPLYCQLNNDAYTRLMSNRDGEACCGGDICEIPNFHPSDLDEKGFYTAQDMKARLAWAENSYLVDKNGNTVLDENGNTIPAKMMTPEQVQKYKEIVESVVGVDWDSENWNVTQEQWFEIGQKVNGTYEDEMRLNGKTRADIPENRQALLKFLEEKGWLFEQFK